jgi:hypothetical protein
MVEINKPQDQCFFVGNISQAKNYTTNHIDEVRVDMSVCIVLSTPLLLCTAYCLYVAYRHHWK